MRSFWVSLVALGLVGCGQAEKNEPAGESAGATGGGSAATGGSGSGVGGGSAGVSGGSGDPVLCGGAYMQQCAEGKLCAFDTTCGAVGHCIRRPTACDKVLAPVCGCDGRTYSNDCGAKAAGVATQHEGECDVPSQFSCGPYACAKGQYCLDKGADGDDLWRYACVPLPEACAGKPSCDCIGEVKSCFTDQECGIASTSVIVICR